MQTKMAIFILVTYILYSAYFLLMFINKKTTHYPSYKWSLLANKRKNLSPLVKHWSLNLENKYFKNLLEKVSGLYCMQAIRLENIAIRSQKIPTRLSSLTIRETEKKKKANSTTVKIWNLRSIW